MDKRVIWALIAHKVDYHPYKHRSRSQTWVRATAPLEVPACEADEAPVCAVITPVKTSKPKDYQQETAYYAQFQSPFELRKHGGRFLRKLPGPKSRNDQVHVENELDVEAFERIVRNWRHDRNDRVAWPDYPLRFFANHQPFDMCAPVGQHPQTYTPWNLQSAQELETARPVISLDADMAVASAQRRAALRILVAGNDLLVNAAEPAWGVKAGWNDVSVTMHAKGFANSQWGEDTHLFRADRLDDAVAFAEFLGERTNKKVKVEGGAEILRPGDFTSDDLGRALRAAVGAVDLRGATDGKDLDTRAVRAMCDALDIAGQYAGSDDPKAIASQFCEAAGFMASYCTDSARRRIEKHVERITRFELGLTPEANADMSAMVHGL